VFAYGEPADMRKGYDGLSALVTQGLRRDALSGDFYLFANRTRKRAKVQGTPCITQSFARFGRRMRRMRMRTVSST
jgi:transposase